MSSKINATNGLAVLLAAVPAIMMPAFPAYAEADVEARRNADAYVSFHLGLMEAISEKNGWSERFKDDFIQIKRAIPAIESEFYAVGRSEGDKVALAYTAGEIDDLSVAILTMANNTAHISQEMGKTLVESAASPEVADYIKLTALSAPFFEWGFPEYELGSDAMNEKLMGMDFLRKEDKVAGLAFLEGMRSNLQRALDAGGMTPRDMVSLVIEAGRAQELASDAEDEPQL